MKLYLWIALLWMGVVGCSPTFIIHRKEGWLESDYLTQSLVFEAKTDDSIAILQLHDGHWWTTYVNDNMELVRDEQLCPWYLEETNSRQVWIDSPARIK